MNPELCVADGCNRKIGKHTLFCSLECACYSKAFSVSTNRQKDGYDNDGWNHERCKELAKKHGKELNGTDPSPRDS